MTKSFSYLARRVLLDHFVYGAAKHAAFAVAQFSKGATVAERATRTRHKSDSVSADLKLFVAPLRFV